VTLQIAQSKTVVQKIVHQKRCFVQKTRYMPRQPVVLQQVHSTISSFNKSQQDAFLPHVESGLLTFIGATTENPSFEVNSALLSRAVVYVLQPLDEQELQTLMQRALPGSGIEAIEPAAQQRLIRHADGDARRLLGALELAL
jgi:putative ATPase